MDRTNTRIIDGKAHAAAIRADAAKTIAAALSSASLTAPHLAVVLMGSDPASQVYIKGKQTACEEVGIDFTLHNLPEDASEAELLARIDTLNEDKDISGILIQQPLPKHINKYAVVSRVNAAKDVDCLHPHNIGLVAAGLGNILPCTPAGIVTLLKRENIEMAGKHAVIVGRSDVVGKPLAFMLLANDATVTICHSKTKHLLEICRQADILIAAVGIPQHIAADFVKQDAVIIDVGVNRIAPKKVCGDVDYDAVQGIASYITPVPGGVGPMTVATLMENCVKAWKIQNGI